MTSPASTVVAARRPGPRAWWTLVRCETTMVVRDTAGLLVPLGLPLLILVTSAPQVDGTVVAPGGWTALEAFVLPVVVTIVIATTGIINMPSFLAYYRRTGILRRLSVTPASPVLVLIAQVVVSVLQSLLGLVVALAVAVLAFGARAPAHLGTTVAVFLLAVAAMNALGMIVAAVAPTPNSAVAIGFVVFFAVGAAGGMFGGRESLPDPIAAAGGWLPFGAAVDALSRAWIGGAVEPAYLLSLAATVVIGVVVAAALFRWE